MGACTSRIDGRLHFQGDDDGALGRSGVTAKRKASRAVVPAPIQRLPAELMLYIILDLYHREPPDRSLRRARTLILICSRWRRLVLSDSRFWRVVHVSGARALHDLGYALPRSGTNQIEVSVHNRAVHDGFYYTRDSGCSRSQYSSVIRLISRHMSRIRRLDLVISANGAMALVGLASPAPVLQELSIVVERQSIVEWPSQWSLSGLLFSGHAPQLARVELSTMGITRNYYIGIFDLFACRCLLFPSLRVVSISNPDTWDYTNLVTLFAHCPAVEELHLMQCCIIDEADALNTSTHVLQTPALRLLNLDNVDPHENGVDITAVLSRFHLPSVLRLEVRATTCARLRPLKDMIILSMNHVASLEFSWTDNESEMRTVVTSSHGHQGMFQSPCACPDRRCRYFLPGQGSWTVTSLSLPLDCAIDLVRDRNLSPTSLESLTLTHDGRDFSANVWTNEVSARGWSYQPQWTSALLRTIDVFSAAYIEPRLLRRCLSMFMDMSHARTATLKLRSPGFQDQRLEQEYATEPLCFAM